MANTGPRKAWVAYDLEPGHVAVFGTKLAAYEYALDNQMRVAHLPHGVELRHYLDALDKTPEKQPR